MMSNASNGYSSQRNPALLALASRHLHSLYYSLLSLRSSNDPDLAIKRL